MSQSTILTCACARSPPSLKRRTVDAELVVGAGAVADDLARSLELREAAEVPRLVAQ